MENNINQQKTILVAEDVESNFLLLNALLGKTFCLRHANNGQEAIEMFTQSPPDLILMDVKMPIMDGLTATRLIREISATIPIIALTAFAFDQDRIKAINAGCNDFLTKPISLPLLKEMIKKYI